jgi:methyltransferase FkbM-like protein
VIKIDVEGHELAVLKGARKTLADPALAAVVMEVNGSGDRCRIGDEEVIAEIRSYGFSPYGYDPFMRRLLDWNSSIDNAIFLRSRSDVSSILVEARRYRLINRSI